MTLLEKFKNSKDDCFIVPYDLIKNKVVYSSLPLADQVKPSVYALIAWKALCAKDDRFQRLSDVFTDVCLRSLASRLLSSNLDNQSSSFLIYPSYCYFLQGVYTYLVTEKIEPVNKFDFSLVKEIKFIKDEAQRIIIESGAKITLSEEDQLLIEDIKKLKAS